MKLSALALAPVAALLLNSAHADVIVANSADTGISYNASGNGLYQFQDVGNYENRIGELYDPGAEAYVIPFKLPTLAAGDVFTAANLQTQLYAIAGTPANADLAGLGTLVAPLVSASATVGLTDYYQGATPDPTATLIQSAYLTSSTPLRTSGTTGFVTNSTAGELALTAYLNAAYDGGAHAGDYVFLRVSYDVNQPTPNGNNAYELLTADAGGSLERPQINFTYGLAPTPPAGVPEPSSYMMLGMGVGVLLFMLRRQNFGARA